MNKIDEIFKNGLDWKGQDYSESEWKKLEQQLKKKKKSRKVIFWIWTAFGLMLIPSLIVGISFLQSENEELLENSETTLNKSNIGLEANTEYLFMDKEAKLPETIRDNHEITLVSDKKEPVKGLIPLKKEIEVVSEMSESNLISANHNQDNIFTKSELLPERLIGYELILRSPDLLYIDKFPSKEMTKSDPPKFKSHRWYFSLMPFASVLNYNKIYQIDANTNYKEEENTRQSNAYGIYLTAKKKNLSIMTGLSVFELKEVTNYTNTIHHWDYNHSYIVENKNYGKTKSGMPIILIREVIDSTLTIYEETPYPNNNVSFSYLSIPTQIQYSFGIKRLTYFTGIGLNFSFLRKSEGIYASKLTPNNTGENQLEYEDLTQSENINKFLVDGELTTGLKYNVTKRTALMVSYAYSRSLNSMMTGYKQKTQINQFRFGVEMRVW